MSCESGNGKHDEIWLLCFYWTSEFFGAKKKWEIHFTMITKTERSEEAYCHCHHVNWWAKTMTSYSLTLVVRTHTFCHIFECCLCLRACVCVRAPVLLGHWTKQHFVNAESNISSFVIFSFSHFKRNKFQNNVCFLRILFTFWFGYLDDSYSNGMASMRLWFTRTIAIHWV